MMLSKNHAMFVEKLAIFLGTVQVTKKIRIMVSLKKTVTTVGKQDILEETAQMKNQEILMLSAIHVVKMAICLATVLTREMVMGTREGPSIDRYVTTVTSQVM